MRTDAELSARALSRAVGLDLRVYREAHIAERIRRAIERESVKDIGTLALLLSRDPEARARFRRSVAITVSTPFRDAEQFALLEREVVPELLASGKRLTVWSAGCADGAELYSVGMVVDRLESLDRATLLGSDVLEENIALARRGSYGDWHVPAAVRARTRWEQRDLVQDGPPPGKWRLVLCRNVAIYLNRNAKEALHATLARALAIDGILLVGRSERIGSPAQYDLERIGAHTYRKLLRWD